MSKHTPGPWIDWKSLEWLYEPQRLLARTEDARLIAAAPEMLEMLKRLDNSLESLGRSYRLQIREVIAKAEGRNV